MWPLNLHPSGVLCFLFSSTSTPCRPLLKQRSLLCLNHRCEWIDICVLCFQLLVGSEDFDIRVFKEDELVCEMTENEVNGCTVFYSF